MIEMFVRFTHLDKEFDYLPGMTPATMASLLGLEYDTYRQLREELDAQARQAALGLLTDAEFAEHVARLPFTSAHVVVGLGDSITDDLQGWLEILRHLLDIRGDAPKIVNLGRSAYTSAMALRRLAVPIRQDQPDWVLCMLGNGDMSRVNGELQTSVDETERVLRAIRTTAGDVRWVWLTPPPVHEPRVDAFEPFGRGLATWRNADIVALGDRIRAFAEPVVDVQAVYGVPPKPEFQGPDGVHPSLAGQTATARALVEQLSEVQRLP
jgi:lysophospholipase L1-like esterase